MHYTTLDTSDEQDVKQLFIRTFAESEGQSEGELIGGLVLEILTATPADDFCGFVACKDDQIIGCIIFSRLLFESKVNSFLLSPVAISPDYQRQGVGQGLINFGLAALKRDGVELVFTYGDPGYYSKVGFRTIMEEVVKAPLTLSFSEGWLGQSLVGDGVDPIAGRSRCIEAFNKPEIW